MKFITTLPGAITISVSLNFRDGLVSFDPLLVFFGSATPDKTGWYTCMAGNSEGSSEISTYLDVRAGNSHDTQAK